MPGSKFTQDQKDRAVRLLIDQLPPYPSVYKAAEAVGAKIGASGQSVQCWYEQHLDQTGPDPVTVERDRERIKTLERENWELERANNILKLPSRFNETTWAFARLGCWLRRRVAIHDLGTVEQLRL